MSRALILFHNTTAIDAVHFMAARIQVSRTLHTVSIAKAIKGERSQLMDMVAKRCKLEQLHSILKIKKQMMCMFYYSTFVRQNITMIVSKLDQYSFPPINSKLQPSPRAELHC